MQSETRRERWLKQFIALSFARPLLVMLAFLLVGGGSAYFASKLIFRGSFVELLPREAREVKDLELVAKKAGGDGYLVMQVLGASPESLRRYAEAVAPEIEKLEEVRYVEYRYDVSFFHSRALLLLPAEKLASLRGDLQARIEYEKQSANPLFVDLLDEPPPTFAELEKKYASEAPQGEYMVSKDGRELYLFIKPTGLAGDLDYSKRLLTNVDRIADEVAKEFPGLKTDYTGAYRIRIEEDVEMKKDLARASGLSALIALTLILLATRRGSALIVVGAPVALGLAITFAVAQITIGYLNVVTGFLVAILIGLGIEYGIHLSMRYWEERRLKPAQEAMVAAFSGTFVGALTSAATNAAAFFVLLFAQFHAFAQFGFIAGVGVLLTVSAAYGVGPAILAIAERIRPLKALPPERVEALQARHYARLPTPLISAIALLVVLFAGFSLWVSPNLSFESDLRKLKGHSPATELDDHIAEQIGVKITPAILLVDDLPGAAKVTELIAEVKAKHGETTAFHKAASLNDLVPYDLENRRREMAGIGALLEDLPESMKEGETGEKVADFQKMLKAEPWGTEEVPLALRRRFMSLDGQGTFVLLFPRYSGYDAAEIKLWADQIAEVVTRAEAEGVTVNVLDGNLIAARVFSLVRGDGPFILWGAAGVVFFMIVLALRSVKRAALVAGPLFLGMICLAGGMHLFDVKLNFINAVVLPNLLAIAVDNSIHLYHRYREEGPGSLGHVVRNTGLAAVVATLSNAAGYGALLVASHQGLRSIGQLAVLGVVSTFLGTTVFFPSLLALIERWKERGGKAGPGGELKRLSLESQGAKRAGEGEAEADRRSA